MRNLSVPYKIILGIFCVVWVIIILRLVAITLRWSDYYEQIVKRNIFKQEVIIPMRGHIFDRQDKPLAVNEMFFSISLDPFLNQQDLQDAARLIATHIKNQSEEAIIQEYEKRTSNYNHEPIKVVDFISYDEMQSKYAILLQHDKILVQPTFKRLYPNGTLASHIIGYVGAADEKDIFYNPVSKYTRIIGKDGIEKQYNAILQGDLGYRKSIVNAYNQKISQIEESISQIQNHITLTLDSRLQKLIDREYSDKYGAAIVMNVHNGEILAAGSYPEYDLNDFVGGISVPKWKALMDNIHTPLINRIVNGQYPPGSAIKMGVMMSILEYADIDEYTKVETPYSVKIGNWSFRDWKYGGHGESDAFKAIRESVDVYFYKLSQVVGINNMTEVLEQMGFGQLTGIDLPRESSGVLPTPDWKIRRWGQAWHISDTVQASIGQGLFLVTPMQIARYTALIASGKMPTPHFIKKLNNEEVVFDSQDVLNNFQKSKLWVLQRGMVGACNAPGGTGTKRTQGAMVKIACKTGTAQVTSIPQDVKKRLKESEMEYFHRSHAWMTGYVPADDPKYAITILIEHGQSGGNAGPIMVSIVNELYQLGYFNDQK